MSRQFVGTAVFAGILALTALGIFFIPALYVFMQGREKWTADSEYSSK